LRTGVSNKIILLAHSQNTWPLPKFWAGYATGTVKPVVGQQLTFSICIFSEEFTQNLRCTCMGNAC